MLLILLKILPVLDVRLKINLVDGPKAGHLVLVHLPDVVVLDGEQDKAVRVILKQWLRQGRLALSAIDDAKLRGGSELLRRPNLTGHAAVACIVLVEHLGAGAFGSVLLGLRELLRHRLSLVLLVPKDL